MGAVQYWPLAHQLALTIPWKLHNYGADLSDLQPYTTIPSLRRRSDTKRGVSPFATPVERLVFWPDRDRADTPRRVPNLDALYCRVQGSGFWGAAVQARRAPPQRIRWLCAMLESQAGDSPRFTLVPGSGQDSSQSVFLLSEGPMTALHIGRR